MLGPLLFEYDYEYRLLAAMASPDFDPVPSDPVHSVPVDSALAHPYPRELYRADPVACWVIDRLHLNPVSFGFLIGLLTAGVYLIAAAISGTLLSKPGHVGLLDDWLPWMWVCFLNPIIMGYYLWSFTAIATLLQDLEAADAVEITAEDLKRVALPYQQAWRKFLALGIGVCGGIIMYFSQLRLNNWTGGTIPSAAVALLGVFYIYMGSMLVLTLITNVWVLHRTFVQKPLTVNPLHPDRCGGLRPLSQYSLKTAYLAAVFGVLVGLIEYQFIIQHRTLTLNSPVHLLLLLHIALSLACFFGPLLAAHNGMQAAKEALLRTIAHQFHKDYSQIHTNLEADAETLKKQAAKLQELRSFYTVTDEFPVWPFDVTTFRRYLLSVTTPLLPVIVGVVQKGLPNLLKAWGIPLG